jgi:hypothetical protein
VTYEIGANKKPATAAKQLETIQTTIRILVMFIPCKAAASWSCWSALIAKPNLVF